MKHINYSLFILSLLTLLSCGQANEEKEVAVEAIDNSSKIEEETDFNVSFEIKKIDDKHFNLVTSIELDKGCHVISPYSPDTILLPVNLIITENETFTLDSTLIEYPISTTEYDSLLETNVNYVRENTSYTQRINLNTQQDFEVNGQVELLIEPRCIPYQIDFTISNASGELTVSKTKTFSLL